MAEMSITSHLESLLKLMGFIVGCVLTGVGIWSAYKSGFYNGERRCLGGSMPEPVDKPLPWLRKPLAGWSIVGMNHYHREGSRYIFVAIVKDGYCIVEEGPDDYTLWDRLCKRAVVEG